MARSHLIKRTTPSERLVHWVHMLSFLVLVVTGLGLYARSFFGLTGLFGGVDMSRVIHHYAGLIFTASTVGIFFQWHRDASAPGEDTFRDVVKSHLDRSFQARSGKLDAGQKVFFWVVVVSGLVLATTGLALWFPGFLGRGLQQWMYFLHNFAFIFLMIWIAVHVYLSTAGVPGTWSAMTRGTVTRQWAAKHHPEWDVGEGGSP